MFISTLNENQQIAWDKYVRSHPRATAYHLSGWKNVIERTYGHRTYYLMVIKNDLQLETRNTRQKETGVPPAMRYDPSSSNPVNPSNPINPSNLIVGILPLIHIKHFMFGNSLVSMPFLDYGGILADHQDTEKALLSRATELGQELKTTRIELRHIEPLSWLSESPKFTAMSKELSAMQWVFQNRSHKVRMLLSVPEDPETLMKSFRSKLRSQIKKPIKEGCTAVVGHLELLNTFYEVFSTNMRDLGSPVHSRRLIKNVLNEFPDDARICMVFKGNKRLAGSVVIGFKDTLENPWASSLREFGRLSPNMLLYWTMLAYACNQGFKYFDFGRSSLDEGSYKFKEQWGAKPVRLNWHYILLNGNPIHTGTSEKSKFAKAIKLWQKLPVPITKIIGPRIRKYIGL